VLSAPAPRSGSLLSYVWQEYLPRLPSMQDQVVGVQPWSLWFKGLVGRFGWLDYGYPEWAYALALIAVVAVSVAAGRIVWRRRRGHGRELAVFALAAAGLLGAIAAVSYRAAPPFDQARYLLPLLPLFALVPALAVHAAGPRRGPTLAAVLIVAAIGFSGYAQLLTLARYYG
jgi:phosphoglycerol transferase MdoB-like AlkP superfamily enzyme